MRKILSVLLILTSFILISCEKVNKAENDNFEHLSVIVSDGIWARDFWPPAVAEFESLNTCKIDFVFAEMDNSFLLDVKGDSLQADVILGINEAYSTILDTTVFIKYKPKTANLSHEFIKLNKCNLTPVFFSYLALLYKNDQIETPPTTFGGLQDGIWVDSMIIPSAETSMIGRSNLLWSVAAFGKNGFGHFWRSIKNNVSTITESSDNTFRMFLADEAPMILWCSSYKAYLHKKEINNVSVQFLQEGSYQTVFQGGIRAKSHKIDLSKEFMDYLLTTEFQTKIPTGLFMYPVNKNVELPESFDDLELPEKILNKNLNQKESKINMKYWISKWKKRVK